jgi:hypothetical protein
VNTVPATQPAYGRRELTTAQALTLMQPWAHAITDLGKNVENRTWAPRFDLPCLLIHAGMTWDNSAPSFFRLHKLEVPGRDQLPLGAIVAVARVDRICRATVGAPHHTCNCGPWAGSGQYHWRLTDVVALPEPVRCRGQLGLWAPAQDVLAAVTRQLVPPVVVG